MKKQEKEKRKTKPHPVVSPRKVFLQLSELLHENQLDIFLRICFQDLRRLFLLDGEKEKEKKVYFAVRLDFCERTDYQILVLEHKLGEGRVQGINRRFDVSFIAVFHSRSIKEAANVVLGE